MTLTRIKSVFSTTRGCWPLQVFHGLWLLCAALVLAEIMVTGAWLVIDIFGV